MLADSIKEYKKIINDSEFANDEFKIIEEKKVELLAMADIAFSNEDFFTTDIEDEEEEIKEIAKLQAKLDVYAYTHKKDIYNIRKKVEELGKLEKTPENRQKLLEEIETIRIKYQIFGRYIEEKDFEDLYKVKFDVLMSDINKRLESPLKHIDPESKEFECYIKIIEEKTSKILMGENPEVKKTFGYDKLPEAVKLISKILKNGNRTFNFEDILKDKQRLRLIFAFDKPDGIEKMTFNKDEAKVDFYDYFQWARTIPVKSLHQLTEPEYSLYVNGIEVEDNLYVKLYRMHDEFIKSQQSEKEEEFPPRVHKIPEGIVRILVQPKEDGIYPSVETYRNFQAFRNRKHDKIILPSSLKYIGKGFLNYNYMNEIEFNEGLEEIGDEAFCYCPNLGRYKSMKMPQTLRKIGDDAFFRCYNMAPLILNEGLEEIGDFAFWGSRTDYEEKAFAISNIVIIPSTVKKVGNCIVNPYFVPHLGFKNYNGQDIPEELFSMYEKGIDEILPNETIIIMGDNTYEQIQEREKVKKSQFIDILLFQGDSFEPYMRIDAKEVSGVKDKSAKLKEIVAKMKENDARYI